jgi:hypothetical protein
MAEIAAIAIVLLLLSITLRYTPTTVAIVSKIETTIRVYSR